MARAGAVSLGLIALVVAGLVTAGRARDHPVDTGGHPAAAGGHLAQTAVPAGGSGRADAADGGRVGGLAARYLAIAEPANRRLDAEVDGVAEHERDDLAVAEAALRAEAATERRFDRQLTRIPFPPRIAGLARALIQANQRRAVLTAQQAAAPSVTGLLSFTRRHRAADADVEVWVRAIRRALGLPPPDTS